MSRAPGAPLILVCLASCTFGSRAQAQPGLVIQTESRTVLVDAVVTGKRGEFVHDLTSQDFHIWQDGKEQAVTSVARDATSTDQHFRVLFFDDTRMAAQDQALARRSAARFIDANAGPRRLMAVVSFNCTLRIAQIFTGNAGRLKGRDESSGGLQRRNHQHQAGTRGRAGHPGGF